MSDLKLIKDLLDTFGISAILVAAVIFAIKLWPSVSKGAKWLGEEYIGQMRDRVKVETEIDNRLKELNLNIERSILSLVDYEKRSSERINSIRQEFHDRLHNIETVMSDKMWPALNSLERKIDDHFEEFDGLSEAVDTIREHHSPKKKYDIPPSLLIDTDEFRVLRAKEQEQTDKQKPVKGKEIAL